METHSDGVRDMRILPNLWANPDLLVPDMKRNLGTVFHQSLQNIGSNFERKRNSDIHFKKC